MQQQQQQQQQNYLQQQTRILTKDSSRQIWNTIDLVSPDSLSPVENLWENFLLGVNESRVLDPGTGKYLGYRINRNGPYVFDSYADVRDRALAVNAGLRMFGVKSKDRIGIYSINRPEWVIADLACCAGNLISVPIYDTLGEDALSHIINQTEMRICFASFDKAVKLLNIRRSSSTSSSTSTSTSSISYSTSPSFPDKGKGKGKGKEMIPSLDTIILLNEETDDNKKSAITIKDLILLSNQTGIRIIRFRALEKDGVDSMLDSNFETNRMPRRHDIYTICYTSGTTGMPKGVVLTHGNILAELNGLCMNSRTGLLFTPTSADIHISYLPLAHVFERVMMSFMSRAGGQIGFYAGNNLTLMDDIAILKPTIFISVPRIFNKLYDRVLGTVSKKGGLAECLFKKAMKSKTGKLTMGETRDFLWDRLVFAKIRAKLGGRVRTIITGSAPINEKVINFLRIAFNAEVFEGYGQTETSAGLTVTLKGDFESGHVGVPLPCSQIKLADVPELQYFNTDTPFPRGEILVRGGNVFSGYYKEPEKTKEVFTEDGWYRTGDVGMFDGKGRLVIIDRANSIFKLSQGEYVAPEKIETILQSNCSTIQSIFVTGNSLESTLVAIVIPDTDGLSEARRSRDNDVISDKDLIQKEICSIARENGLKGFEIPKNIAIFTDPFPDTILTPTFKLKRKLAREHYDNTITEMYKGLEGFGKKDNV